MPLLFTVLAANVAGTEAGCGYHGQNAMQAQRSQADWGRKAGGVRPLEASLAFPITAEVSGAGSRVGERSPQDGVADAVRPPQALEGTVWGIVAATRQPMGLEGPAS